MDKRFLLALVLTAIVVIATPILFRTPTTSIQPDSAVVARTDSVGTTPANPTPVENPVQGTANVPGVGPARDTGSVVAAVPETTTVSTPVAAYHLSTLGASPLSVDIKSYKALDG